jgi:hypothetical protein
VVTNAPEPLWLRHLFLRISSNVTPAATSQSRFAVACVFFRKACSAQTASGRVATVIARVGETYFHTLAEYEQVPSRKCQTILVDSRAHVPDFDARWIKNSSKKIASIVTS